MKKVALIYGTQASSKTRFLNRLQTNWVKIDEIGSIRDLKLVINGVSGNLIVAVSWGESMPLDIFALDSTKVELAQFNIKEIGNSSSTIKYCHSNNTKRAINVFIYFRFKCLSLIWNIIKR